MVHRLLALLTLAGALASACASPPAVTPDAAPVADARAPDDAAPDDAPPACTSAPAASEPAQVAGQLGRLGGTLELPAGCPPFPVVVILSGSGTTDRDGNADGQGPSCYRLLAEGLRDAGIASVRYDDHGIGASVRAAPANVEDFRFDLEVEDAGRWATHVRADPRFARVLFAGHSQGSLTALLAAQHVAVDGVVSLAGTALPAGRLLLAQSRPHLGAADYATLEHAITELEAGRTVSGLTGVLSDWLPFEVQPYLISWFRFDPLVEVTRAPAPLLLVHGTVDHLVPLEHARMLAAARPDATLAVIDGMAHVLKAADDTPASQQAAANDPSVPLADGLIDAVAAFVRALPRRR